ncbi:MAG: hypothetical protein KDJ19_06065 [Hyphomicrobiaceae bacterium]|nr:hypothetical protein [Hyphomicrobiaceae bacterium]MCC0023036.1 hypothetical protein [Hyphomicrobiaceae bacterium]
MKKLALLIIALFSAVPVADAAETQSLSMSDNASVRLVTSGQRLADGTMWAGIDIAMPPDTNTYWRVPGETGVPLVMDWNQSRNITDAEIIWPMPRRVVKAGFTDYVYEGNTLFPVKLMMAGSDAVWRAHLTLGICNEICVPVSVDLEIALNADQKDMASQIRIQQALAETPLEEDADNVFAAPPEFDTITNLMTIRLKTPLRDPASSIIATADPSLVFAQPLSFPDNSLQFRLLSRTPERMTQQDQIDFLFDTSDGPYFVTSRFDIVGSDR